MSISKKKSASSDKLAMGLNSRGGGGDRNATARRNPPRSVLDDDDDDDNDGDDDTLNDNLSGREAVNRSIAKQQAAIRTQAAAALATTDESIYDYDGIYDSIQHTNTTNRNSATDATTMDSRKSRYIEDLMKTAKVRKMERDIAFDRKVARDQQAEEEAQPEFRNKDKFITSSYQRQLEERHQYEQQESKRQQIESDNDVTKRPDGGIGIARLYSNLSKETHSTANEDSRTNVPSSSLNENILQNHGNEKHSKQERPDGTPTTTIHPTNDGTSQMRLVREQKVQAARDRYLQRHNITAPVV